jgi:hypothetical protein
MNSMNVRGKMIVESLLFVADGPQLAALWRSLEGVDGR